MCTISAVTLREWEKVFPFAGSSCFIWVMIRSLGESREFLFVFQIKIPWRKEKHKDLFHLEFLSYQFSGWVWDERDVVRHVISCWNVFIPSSGWIFHRSRVDWMTRLRHSDENFFCSVTSLKNYARSITLSGKPEACFCCFPTFTTASCKIDCKLKQ